MKPAYNTTEPQPGWQQQHIPCKVDIGDLVQDCSMSSAITLELLQSYT